VWRGGVGTGVLLALAVAACGGDDGEDQLIDVATEPPGADCPAGGAAIRSGTDTDGDGELDDEEVTSTRFVCSEADSTTLVRVDAEAPGASCAGGGVAIHTGEDANHNGLLDDDEIAATEYVCGPEPANNPEVLEGDVLVANQLDAAHLVGVRVVTGTLRIDAPGLAAMDLSALEEVGVDFIVESLDTLDCPLLAAVGGSVEIGGEEIEHLVLPDLAAVGGEVTVQAPWLETIDLSALSTVAARVEIRGGLMTELALPALATTGGESRFGDGLLFEDVPELVNLAVPALTSTPGVHVRENMSLTDIDFASLSAAEIVDIADNRLLPSCEATALAEQSGATTVIIQDNDDEGVCP